MGLLKTMEYLDLVEVALFMHEEYEWPALGHSNSFHSQFSEAFYNPGNDTMVYVEIPDYEGWEGHSTFAYIGMIGVFKLLMKDGHLPERDEFQVKVWW